MACRRLRCVKLSKRCVLILGIIIFAVPVATYVFIEQDYFFRWRGPSMPSLGDESFTGKLKHVTDLNTADPHDLMKRTVVVTGVSENHLKESKGMIGSVQRFLPKNRIIVYDLGLTQKSAKEVQRFCNVELRSFDFGKYPRHVKDLHTYAFKPLIIRDTLAEFGIIFWGDASARFWKDPLILFTVLKEQNGFMSQILEYKAYTMILRTHPKMFTKLGVDVEKFKKDNGYAMLHEANRLLFVNTDLIWTKIVVPWVECALDKSCISPFWSVVPEHWRGPIVYTNRFDQASLSLIVYKNLRGIWNIMNDKSELFSRVVSVSRTPLGYKNVQYCKR